MKAKEKDISVIIPCYNTKPEYLQEAVNSVHAYKGNYSYEIVVINDGCTHEDTMLLLNKLKDQGIKVIEQQNQGPAAARNNGVRQCQSNYILCLDSDNKIKPEYIDEGINALNKNSKAAVVYSKPQFIGDASEKIFKTEAFNLEKLLLENYIDMCAIIRRQAWEEIGGLDENLIQHEDWEFWINLYKAGWKFAYINKIMFEYRIRKESLIRQFPEKNFKKAVEYIYTKHWSLVYKAYHRLYATRITYVNDMKRPLRSFIKYSKKKYLS